MSMIDIKNTVERSVRFGPSQRKRALRKIGTYVNAGINLPEALRQMARFASKDGRDPGNYSSRVFTRWQRKVASGRPLAESMKGYIPEAERQMITAAEKYGRLAEGIEKALSISEGMKRIRGAIVAAVTYPIILTIAIIAFMVYMNYQIFPGFADSLPKEQWPKTTANLDAVSSFVTSYLIFICAGIGALAALFLWSLPRWTGPIRDMVDEYPPYSVYKTVFGTVFLLSVAGYVKAGMNTPEIMQTMMKTASPWYVRKLRAIYAELGRGATDLGDALARTGQNFPSEEVIEDLRTFAKHKGSDEALEELGSTILESSIERIQNQTKVVFYGSLIGVAGIIFWFVSALFDFSQAVTAAANAVGG